MELFKGIRNKIGKAILSKKLTRIKRIVHYTNISKVKTIGVVWDASRISDFTVLSRFYQKMHERNIDVKIMGYYPGKELPDQYTAIRYLNCLKMKELNWFYHPLSTETETFIKRKHDILIDINFDNLVPLEYITNLSNAGLKVGLLDPVSEKSSFDLMMDLKKPVDTETYLSQIIHYLELINSEKN